MADKREKLFGELRSILHQSADAESWQLLVAHLPKWSQDEYFLEVVKPYLEESLGKWDDLSRIAPPDWGKPLLKGKPSPLLEFARGLDLSASRVGPKALEKLVLCAELGQLVYLNLSGNGLKNEGGQTLATCKHLSNLRVLILSNTKIGNGGAVALANCPYLANLEDLDLSGNDFIDVGCNALKGSKYLAEPIKDKAWSWYSYEREAREAYGSSWE